ncbi:MAG TPA: hypothetical protein VF989_08555 [Polyangiaceae bacterium]
MSDAARRRRVRRTTTALASALVLALLAPRSRAENVAWPDASARTLEPGRVTISLLSPARWGLGKRTELGFHPIWFFALPHVELKHRLVDGGAWLFATRHRLSYPTRFLDLVAGEGAGALLPADTDVPVAVQLDSDALLSSAWTSSHFVTVAAGFAVAPRFSGSEPTLLDFPFLMSRFAPLYAPIVPRVSASFTGPIFRQLRYASEIRAYYLGLEPKTVAVETAFELAWLPSRRARLALGLRREHARYAVGYRTHALPYADFSLGF